MKFNDRIVEAAEAHFDDDGDESDVEDDDNDNDSAKKIRIDLFEAIDSIKKKRQNQTYPRNFFTVRSAPSQAPVKTERILVSD